MPKQDIVSAAIAAIANGQAQVLSDAIGAACDQSALEQKASDGTLTQADVDDQVAIAVAKAQSDDAAALQASQAADAQALDAQAAQDQQAASDAKAAADAALADAQGKLNALSVKEAPEAAVIAGLQNSLDNFKNIVAVLSALPALAPPADASSNS